MRQATIVRSFYLIRCEFRVCYRCGEIELNIYVYCHTFFILYHTLPFPNNPFLQINLCVFSLLMCMCTLLRAVYRLG